MLHLLHGAKTIVLWFLRCLIHLEWQVPRKLLHFALKIFYEPRNIGAWHHTYATSSSFGFLIWNVLFDFSKAFFEAKNTGYLHPLFKVKYGMGQSNCLVITLTSCLNFFRISHAHRVHLPFDNCPKHLNSSLSILLSTFAQAFYPLMHILVSQFLFFI